MRVCVCVLVNTIVRALETILSKYIIIIIIIKIKCFLLALRVLFPLPSCSSTLLLSIVFVAVKKEEGGMGWGLGAVPVMSGVISAINCFVAASSSAAFRVAIRSNIAKDTEYIY